MLVFDMDWTDMKPTLTMVTPKNSQRTSSLLFSLAAVELVTLSVFYALLFYNVQRKTRQQRDIALTERYQIDENIRAIRLMIPMVWTHFWCFMPSLVGLSLYLKVFFRLHIFSARQLTHNRTYRCHKFYKC